MHILLDNPPETHTVARPVAIWPVVALTVAALIGAAVSTAATADLPDLPDPTYDVHVSTSYRAV